MTTSPDHPQLQFVQAAGYTKGRADGPPLWIVIHDMEAHETSDRAEATAQYFANPGDGRNVSSHYCADNNSVVQCVRLGDVAWTVGNRPGNYRGINWELAGFASQTRSQWLDPFGYAMFAQIVPIIRADAVKYGIPLQRRTVDELKAYKPGITSHNDLRVAFGGTTHTDPGPNFPWDVFMQLLGGDDMGLQEWTASPSTDPAKAPFLTQGNTGYAGQQRDTALAFAWQAAHDANTKAAEALTRLATLGNKVDEILALLHDGGTLPSSGPVDLTDAAVAKVADATADEIAADPERDGRDS